MNICIETGKGLMFIEIARTSKFGCLCPRGDSTAEE